MSYLGIQAMREALLAIYPYSVKWRDKVNKFSDDQVIAVYRRMVLKS